MTNAMSRDNKILVTELISAFTAIQEFSISKHIVKLIRSA